MEEESQMYTSSVNDADFDKRSEDDMKYESIVEKRHEMVWKCSGKIDTCSCMYYIAQTVTLSAFRNKNLLVVFGFVDTYIGD